MDRNCDEEMAMERERWQMTVDALDAARQGTATEAQLKHLAREAGLKNWKPNAHARTASVG